MCRIVPGILLTVSTASNVLPRFQPGLRAAKNFDAVMELNFAVEGQVTPVPFVD